MRDFRAEAIAYGLPAHAVQGSSVGAQKRTRRSAAFQNHVLDPSVPPQSADANYAPENTTHHLLPHSSPTPPPPASPSLPERLHRTPRVTVEDWPNPEAGSLDFDYNGLELSPEDVDVDPDDLYSCPHDPDGGSEATRQFLDMSDDTFQAFLREDLGDFMDEEIQAIFKHQLKQEDIDMIRMLAAKLRAHFPRSTYEELRQAFSDKFTLPSEQVAWRRIKVLAGLQSRLYDCCINSCCAYLGKYQDHRTCKFCKEPRYSVSGKPRKRFRYIPLIPQLQALYQSLSMIERLRYRANYQHRSGVIADVFDCHHYRALCRKHVHPDHQYKFFSDPHDLALGLSLDGVTLFKRRRKCNSTAWPLIIVLYNLHPSIRTHLENIICVGVIPGPKQYKDLNSFLFPLLEELLDLESGVETVDSSIAGPSRRFLLRAFLILAFGDIPAITKLLGIRGTNALCPCRACDIWGIKDDNPKSNAYYVPLSHPGGEFFWDASDLPMRTTSSFSTRLAEMDNQTTLVARDRLGQKYGLNSECMLQSLRSIDLTKCFPYDFMHLIYENLVPNLIAHWTGTFKELDQGREHYKISEAAWKAIGEETAAATRTLPARFVRAMPDIAADPSLYKAESYGFWVQYLAPIVLEGRLSQKYYEHLLDLRDIIATCLQFELSNAEISTLDIKIQRWVADYEAYYYQYKESRLSACPLTIHALLHIPFYIRHVAPVWASWTFVMERFCGYLILAVTNRVDPFPCIDNFAEQRAQLRAISQIYDIPIGRPSDRRKITTTAGDVEITSWEKVYDEFPASILGRPVQRSFHVDVQLENQIIDYFGPIFNPHRSPRPRRSVREIKALIDFDSLTRYGRVRIAGGGDCFRTANGDYLQRDNSFVRYVLFPDANARFTRQDDEPVQQIQYGQIQDIFYVELREHGEPDIDRKFLLARILPCDIERLGDATEELVKYKRMKRFQTVVHLNTVEAVVGRVKRHDTWFIVDQSKGAVRTLFTDDSAPTQDDE
ncbi:Transposase family Tnp2 protein [Ceratobasidium sp. AG-Ba]|nr:Transposase family Tnp2 protein [Ceratobasidium sp. AG-Ba]